MMVERITLEAQMERFRGVQSHNVFRLTVDTSDDITLDLEDLYQLRLIIDDTIAHFEDKGLKRSNKE